MKLGKMKDYKRRRCPTRIRTGAQSGSTAKPNPELATVVRRGVPSIKIQAYQTADAIDLKWSTAAFVAFLLRLVVLSRDNTRSGIARIGLEQSMNGQVAEATRPMQQLLQRSHAASAS